MLMWGCGTESNTNSDGDTSEDVTNQKDSVTNPDESIFLIDDQIFSIPSPVQTAFLINGTPFPSRRSRETL